MKLWLVLHLLVQSSFCKIDHDEVHVSEKKGVQNQEYEQVEAHKVDPKQTQQIDHAKIYTGLFKVKRRQHQTVVSSAKGIDVDKRRGFLEEIIVNIRNILTETRSVIERIGHPASAPFPHDSETLRDAISKVLENTALFSDVSLHFPQIFLKKMEKDRKLKTAIVWAYEYSKNTGLMDEDTKKIVHLMAQQHLIIPREEGYENPYDTTENKEEVARKAYEDDQKKRKEKEKEHDLKTKKKKTGPKLTKSEL